MEHIVVNNLEDISIRDYNKAMRGELFRLIENYNEIKNLDEVNKNPVLMQECNDAFVLLFDKFNAGITNKEYTLNVEGYRKINILNTKINHLLMTIDFIEVLINNAAGGLQGEQLIKIETLIKENCESYGIKFSQDYMAVLKKIKAKVSLFRNQNDAEKQRIKTLSKDSDDVADSSLIGLIPFCMKAGFNIREDDSLALLMHAVNSSEKFYKSQKDA